jgi:hypothetical protein
MQNNRNKTFEPNGREMYEHIPFKDRQKYFQIWIFGMKI